MFNPARAVKTLFFMKGLGKIKKARDGKKILPAVCKKWRPEGLFFSLFLSVVAVLVPGPAGAAFAATHTVAPGECLWLIGTRYGVSVAALREANGLTGTMLHPGEELVIPTPDKNASPNGPADSPAAAANGENNAPDTSPSLSVATSAPAQTAGNTYTVQPGDSLYRIGQLSNVGVEALQAANHLSGTLIYPGQELVIPPSGENQAAVNTPSPESRPASSGAGPAVSRGAAATAASVLAQARTLLGHRYVYGGAGPTTFDCSGFTRYVFKTAAGIDLPHNAAAQAGLGYPVPRTALLPGDLVFFGYYGSKGIHHVGIYAGNDQFIHASSSIRRVEYSSLDEGYYRQNYRGATRLLR